MHPVLILFEVSPVISKSYPTVLCAYIKKKKKKPPRECSLRGAQASILFVPVTSTTMKMVVAGQLFDVKPKPKDENHKNQPHPGLVEGWVNNDCRWWWLTGWRWKLDSFDEEGEEEGVPEGRDRSGKPRDLDWELRFWMLGLWREKLENWLTWCRRGRWI